MHQQAMFHLMKIAPAVIDPYMVLTGYENEFGPDTF